MKEKDEYSRYYIKVAFTALVIIGMIVLLTNFLEAKFQKNIKESSQYIMDEYYRCEFSYKDLSYKGICNDGLLDRATSMVEFDMQLKLLELCMSSPYTYRYDVCKDLETK
jgi:hypothetical protein